MTISKRKNHNMNLYQVDINTEIDAISVLVNAYDENEALAFHRLCLNKV